MDEETILRKLEAQAKLGLSACDYLHMVEVRLKQGLIEYIFLEQKSNGVYFYMVRNYTRDNTLERIANRMI